MERGLRAEPMLAQQLCQHRRHNPVEGVATGDAQHAPFGAPYIGEICTFIDLSLRRWLRCRLALRSRDARNLYDRGLGLLFGQRRVDVLMRFKVLDQPQITSWIFSSCAGWRTPRDKSFATSLSAFNAMSS